MIKVDAVSSGKPIHNFWNNVHFHPTDAIEDPWGKRVLDSISHDHVAQCVRIYAMLEDIVTLDKNGNIHMDFEETDRRIDYMVEKGFHLLICMNFMPPDIAADRFSVSPIPRYKGKRINTSAPKDYKLWQEVCAGYAKHLIDRYGEEQVSHWYFHCWNEPDHIYWMHSCPDKDKTLEEFCKLYDYFAEGFSSVSNKLKIGGPSVALDMDFLRRFLLHTKNGLNYANEQRGTKFDFLTIHTYGQFPEVMQATCIMTPMHTLEKTKIHRTIADACGYEGIEIIADEWEATTEGFSNADKYPCLIYRNNERFAAFFFSFIDCYLKEGCDISKVLICLSGQHALSKDFEGYRNFFTKSGFRKPIYNAYALAAMLGNNLLYYSADESVGIIPTKTENGEVIIALYNISENLCKPAGTKHIKLEAVLPDDNYTVTHIRIDEINCNSYSQWCMFGKPDNPTQAQQDAIEQAGMLKPWYPDEDFSGELFKTEIVMTENSVSLIKLTPKL